MPRTLKIPLDWTTVYRNGTSEVFFPVTPWMDAANVGKIRVNFEVRGRISDIEVSAGYQTANVENSPDNHNTVGSYTANDGNVYATSFTDVSANTQGKQLVRLGWVVKNTSGSGLTLARVGGVVDVQECS